MSLPAGHILTAAEFNLAYAPPRCFLYQTATSSFPTSGTIDAVTFDTEQSDPLGWHSLVSNTERVTPTIAGWYHVAAGICFASNATGYRLAQILINGGNRVAEARVTSVGAVAMPINLGGYVQLNGTTDYVSLHGMQTSGGSLNSIAGLGLTFMQVQYVGE